MPFIVEQVLLDQNSQTPPPSPFSVQTFNKGASCSAQGFDYGLGNNKGRCLKVVFYLPNFNIFINVLFYPYFLLSTHKILLKFIPIKQSKCL